jgi:branched-chain amino acid transport system permease protein
MITTKLVIEQLLNGLSLGCMYAIVASGLTIIWGTMRLINFGHGEFYMIGAYMLLWSMTTLSLPPFVGLFLAVLIVFALAVFLEKLTILPLFERPNWENNALVVTVGFSVFFQNFVLRLFGERFHNVPYFIEGTLEFMGVRMAYQRILIFTISTALLLGFWVFIKKARFGLALRATAQDSDAATIMGIKTRGVYTYTLVSAVRWLPWRVCFWLRFSELIPGWEAYPSSKAL